MVNYIHTITSVKTKEYKIEGRSIWKYIATVKNKQTLQVLFESGVNPRRDDACFEVAQFLRNHPVMINEYIN